MKTIGLVFSVVLFFFGSNSALAKGDATKNMSKDTEIKEYDCKVFEQQPGGEKTIAGQQSTIVKKSASGKVVE